MRLPCLRLLSSHKLGEEMIRLVLDTFDDNDDNDDDGLEIFDDETPTCLLEKLLESLINLRKYFLLALLTLLINI